MESLHNFWVLYIGWVIYMYKNSLQNLVCDLRQWHCLWSRVVKEGTCNNSGATAASTIPKGNVQVIYPLNIIPLPYWCWRLFFFFILYCYVNVMCVINLEMKMTPSQILELNWRKVGARSVYIMGSPIFLGHQNLPSYGKVNFFL